MGPESYPALYRTADAASAAAQSRFLWCMRGILASSIVGAGLATAGENDKWTAVVAATVFFVGWVLSILMALLKLENVWYRTRAVAESVKTTTWRFIAKAEPFGPQQDTDTAKGALQTRLHKVLAEHSDLAEQFGGTLAAQPQITEDMVQLRSRGLPERLEHYREHRVKEQREWYANKSAQNRRASRQWIAALIALQTLAICFALLRIASPDFHYWPVTLAAAAATAALTWAQVKRYRELAAVYGLTAHEIGLALHDFDNITSEDQFARAVADAESAFSREHTQWIAKKI